MPRLKAMHKYQAWVKEYRERLQNLDNSLVDSRQSHTCDCEACDSAHLVALRILALERRWVDAFENLNKRLDMSEMYKELHPEQEQKPPTEDLSSRLI